MARDLQVNQKMMKSALIKDLYFEMDRLKQGMPFPYKYAWIFPVAN